MARVVNLNRVRKQKAREDKRRTGDENAARFGRTGAQKALEQARKDKETRDLDGHRKE